MTRLACPLIITLLLAACSTAFAQTETASDNTTATPKYGPVFQLEIKDQAASEGFRGMKVVKKFARRLPNFYGQVVSDTQKIAIYDIQAAYFEPIEMLTLRLERLKEERDAQIEAVLTSEQKAKVEALNKDSLARRAATRAANANAN
ncbi:MAG: hypothetical protein FWH27_18910 [Planctomycetaceae bacterium]|nr:hypothetical protein [Planctomycetaceae bacterium]